MLAKRIATSSMLACLSCTVLALGCLGRFGLAFGPTATPAEGTTELVSLASDGSQADDYSWAACISADGRTVAFTSAARNLVPGDSNEDWDVFVHDRQTGETSRVSVASDGSQGNEMSLGAALSADGRIVAFGSEATNLVLTDTNEVEDVFVHDRQTGETTRVSVASDGSQANGSSWGSAVSGDGRFMVFVSYARNLVRWDTNFDTDVFVHDRDTGETTRVSVSSKGRQGIGGSGCWAVSADGRIVAFCSDASNLVPGDSNGYQDVFVHDRQGGQTAVVRGA